MTALVLKRKQAKKSKPRDGGPVVLHL